MKNNKEKKVKLGFFIHTLGRGGAELVLINLLNGLNEEKYSVTLYTVLNTGELKDKINPNVKVIEIFKVPRILLKRNTNANGTLIKGKNDELSLPARIYSLIWRKMDRILSKYAEKKLDEHDLLISYLEGPTSKMVSNFSSNIKKISWVHVDLSVEKKSEIFFENMMENKRHFERYDHIVAVSNSVKDSLKNYIGLEKEISVVHNVYEAKNIKELSNESMTHSEISWFPKEKINFVSVGRLSRQKGYDRLVDAVDIIRKSNEKAYNQINFVILGDGEMRNSLESKINKLELSDKIKIVGFKSNPYKYIKNADFFISSSRTEGFSTVVVESLIIGTPICTTDCSGMKEIINDGEHGIIGANSVNGIVEIINKSLKMYKTNYDELIETTEIGGEKFDKNSLLEKHDILFETIIANGEVK